MSYPLTTLQQYKQFANITGTSEDNRLELVINAVMSVIESYTGRTFSSSTYTEYYCGDGKPFLVLNQRPVTSITSIHVDDGAYWGEAPDAFPSSTLLTDGTDYALVVDQPDGSSRSGMVYAIQGYWSVPSTFSPGVISPFLGPKVGNIKVVYTAGYSALPFDLQLAVNLLVSRVRNTAAYGQSINSESYEEYSISLNNDVNMHLVTPEVQSILAKYRNVAIA